MNQQDYNTTLIVDQTPEKVFKAINNVRGWWSEEIVGGTENLHDVFDYHYKDVHRCQMQITEMIPNQKVVWEVKENYFNFIKDQSEWVGNTIIFDITEKDGKTNIHFMQKGLVPMYECYDICNNAWTGYIQDSLRSLIESGKGQPNPKED